MSAAARLAALPLAMRRSLALLLVALALLLLWITIVLPVRGLLASQQEWRTDTVRAIARDRGMIKTAPQLREITAAIDASPLRARVYDASATIAPADQLQSDLRTALLASGVEPTNFKVLPGAVTQGLRVHRIEFSSIMSVDQLHAFFLALERQPRYVRIERVRLDAPSVQRNDENPKVTMLVEARAYSVDAPVAAVRVARAY